MMSNPSGYPALLLRKTCRQFQQGALSVDEAILNASDKHVILDHRGQQRQLGSSVCRFFRSIIDNHLVCQSTTQQIEKHGLDLLEK